MRLFREPLVPFALVGLALFGLYRLVAAPSPRRIEITRELRAGLRADFERRSARLPSATEEESLVRDYIDGEVLVREALARGLDRGDVIIRRRLIQKMEFVSEALSPPTAPSEAALASYLRQNPTRYAEPPRLSLQQVFIDAARHGAESTALATTLVEKLRGGADPAALGDPFLRGASFTNATEAELRAVFGAGFAERLRNLPQGAWSAPIPSSYGLHLIRISERRPARIPALSEVRARLRSDWEAEQRAVQRRESLQKLRARYSIHVEGGP